MPSFAEKIEAYIAAQQLLRKEEGRYLVALSGGADSVCLLRVLRALGYDVVAAHCNFHLRAEEADRDEAFCKQLCTHLSVPLHVAHFDTRAYAKERKMSIEMAARALRYDYFMQLLHEHALAAVLVGHHRGDAVETFLINLLRGTGMDGLKGIAPATPYVRRPLLAVTKEEIVAYLAAIKQEYVSDSTNAVADVLRNKVRLLLLPLLRRLAPAAEENIFATATYVQRSLPLLHAALAAAQQRVVSRTERGISIAIEALLREEAPEVVLWDILKDCAFSSAQCEQIFAHLHAATGRQWSSATHTLLVNRGALLLEPALSAPAAPPVVITADGTYRYGDGMLFSVKTVDVDGSFRIAKEADSISIDAAKVLFPLTIRPMQRGDRFVPYGMTGSRLLSDYLTDCRLSLFDKQRQAVLTDAQGRIIWVVGRRIDHRFRITALTRRALLVARSHT